MPEVHLPEDVLSRIVEAHAPWDEFVHLPWEEDPDLPIQGQEIFFDDSDELPY